MQPVRRVDVKKYLWIMSLALILAKTLSTGSSSLRYHANDEFHVFNEIGRCENDINQYIKGNEEIISDCVSKHLSSAMNSNQKNKIIQDVLSKSQHWSGSFKCKKSNLHTHSICFNVVQGDRQLLNEVVFRTESGSLKIVAIKSEQ